MTRGFLWAKVVIVLWLRCISEGRIGLFLEPMGFSRSDLDFGRALISLHEDHKLEY